MNEELKPCPFCGCHLYESDMKGDGTGVPRFSIKCPDCPGGMQFFSSNKSQAIAAWNRRASDRPSVVGYLYEHDGTVHDKDNPPIFRLPNDRMAPCAEPWNETALVALDRSSKDT
jgi:Lar family restriction alleviation protein